MAEEEVDLKGSLGPGALGFAKQVCGEWGPTHGAITP